MLSWPRPRSSAASCHWVRAKLAPIVRLEVFEAESGKAWHRAYEEAYYGRNSSATAFFAIGCDGVTTAGKKTYTVPDGQYVVRLSVLKAPGDDSNPGDWETWTSPAFTIERP
jgi:minor extracellular serine protease Vpr